MELEFEDLRDELLRFLDGNKTWVLATSDGRRVSARSMSIIHVGADIYFQTDRRFEKYRQMMQNGNVALCCSNVSIEGLASDIGPWKDNLELKELYLEHHKGSFEAYGSLASQVVIKITPHYAVFWKYIGGKPARDFLYLAEKKAERQLYLEAPG